MCVHCDGTQTYGQRTFGEIVGLASVVPIQPDLVECPNCGVSTRDVLMADCEGNEVCADCFGETSFHCEECDCVDSIDDAYSDDETGEMLCEECYDERYATCPGCLETVRIGSDDCVEHESWLRTEHWHGECYWEVHTTCDDCGVTINRDDAYYSERSGECYCSGCRREEECEGKRFSFNADDKAGDVRSLRTFGVELETAECDGFEELDGRTYFSAKDDGSIDGKEFVSGVLRGERGLEAIREFCRAARGFDVDSSCGFHLHIGFTDLDDDAKLAVMLAYHYTQDAWFSFVDDDRADNTFCRKFGWNCSGVRSWDDIVRYTQDNRYRWVNVCSFDKHGTIEVRLHGGTLDAQAITDWVCSHIRFVEHFAIYAPDDVRAMFQGNIKGDIGPQAEALRMAWDDAELYERMADKAQRESGTTFEFSVEA